jgi:Protein of unknown function (DUF3467)
MLKMTDSDDVGMKESQINKPDPYRKTLKILDPGSKRRESFVEIYSNNVTYGLTFFDVSITFGAIVPNGPDSAHIEERAVITMSIEQAKAMAIVLHEMLSQYQISHGTIRTLRDPQ